MKYTILILFSLLVGIVKGQPLKSQTLTKADVKNGIIKKYWWVEEHIEGGIQLMLYKNNRFKFVAEVPIMGTEYGEGSWRIEKRILILNSDIQEHNIPIEVVRNEDTTGRIEGFDISIIKDLKGSALYALVCINQDSIKCAPDLGLMNGKHPLVDSIKVRFDNGMTSKWVSLIGQHGYQIHVTVQVDRPVSSFFVLDDMRYKIAKGNLIPVDTE